MFYLLIIGFCFIIATLTSPYMIKLAHFTKAVDAPNKRKIHQRVMPRMGGLAIYISFILGYMVFNVKQLALVEGQTAFFDAFFISSVVIIITGMFDDMFDLPAKSKFIVQLVVALIMVIYGRFIINEIRLPFIPIIDLGWLSGVITIAWIIGVTNSINLIDGLDGLSSGCSAISFATMAILAIFQGDIFVAVMCCLLLGATLGFLVHNFYPAKIFMGDTGSLFLGFSISVLSLLGYKNAAFVSFIVPIVVLSIPIFDTVWAIFRRILNGQSPFKPDRRHVHHQLLDKNLGHVKSVLVLYAIAGLFSLTAIVYTIYSKFYGLVLVVCGVIVVELIFNITGIFREKQPKEKNQSSEESHIVIEQQLLNQEAELTSSNHSPKYPEQDT